VRLPYLQARLQLGLTVEGIINSNSTVAAGRQTRFRGAVTESTCPDHSVLVREVCAGAQERNERECRFYSYSYQECLADFHAFGQAVDISVPAGLQFDAQGRCYATRPYAVR
jgi:hypothetical protein